jgi:hypothetical protein
MLHAKVFVVLHIKSSFDLDTMSSVRDRSSTSPLVARLVGQLRTSGCRPLCRGLCGRRELKRYKPAYYKGAGWLHLTPIIIIFLKCEPRAKDLPYSLIKEKFRSLEWLQHPKNKSLLSRQQITQTLGTRKHPKSNLTLNCI